MEERIKKVFSNVFNLDIETINNESSPDNIESWDSLKHMNLILALEEEFEIEGIKPIKFPEGLKLSPSEMGLMEEVVDMSVFLDDDEDE